MKDGQIEIADVNALKTYVEEMRREESLAQDRVRQALVSHDTAAKSYASAQTIYANAMMLYQLAKDRR